MKNPHFILSHACDVIITLKLMIIIINIIKLILYSLFGLSSMISSFGVFSVFQKNIHIIIILDNRVNERDNKTTQTRLKKNLSIQ